MNMLSQIVMLLSQFSDDVSPKKESEIIDFAEMKSLLLREDHINFLARFCAPAGGRLNMFKSYGGDFDFLTFKRAYLDEQFPLQVPAGCAYFGTSFTGQSFCIDHDSGNIFEADENHRGGLVYEGIEAFLLSCMILAYDAQAFAAKEVRENLDNNFVLDFRRRNHKNIIAGANVYAGGFVEIELPKAIVEYYMVDGRLIYLFLPSNHMRIFGGGILNNLLSDKQI